jgi:hypothetical protein
MPPYRPSTEATRIGSGGWFESFPDLARLSWPGLNAVIGGLKPGDLTLDLFQRLPAELLGQSTWLLGAERSFAEKT